VVVVDVVAGAVVAGAVVVVDVVAGAVVVVDVVAGAVVVGAAATRAVVVGSGVDVVGATVGATSPVVGTVPGGVISTTGGSVSTGTAATAGAKELAPRAKIDNTATAARRLWVLGNTRRGPIGLLRPKSPQRSRRVPNHPHQVVEGPEPIPDCHREMSVGEQMPVTGAV